MRAQTWGPFAVLLGTPVLVALGTSGTLAVAILPVVLGTVALVLPLTDLMRDRHRARPRSAVAAVHARRPWLAALGSSLLLTMTALPLMGEHESLALVIARGALAAGVLGLLYVDIRALRRLARGVARPETLRSPTPGTPPPDRATLVIDFGVGDGELVELAPSRAVYREPERVLRLVRGSLPEARRALVHGIAFDLFVLVPSLIAVLVWLVPGRLP